MIVNGFAYALRARRKEKRLTQGQLAERVGCTNKDISAYERGECYPRKTRRSEIEKVLGSLPTGRSFKTPRCNKQWRKYFKDRRRWRPKKERSLASRLKTAGHAYPRQMELLSAVVSAHRTWFSAARQGSSLELLFGLLAFALQGAIELSVRPVSWGFRHLPICDPETGECRADYAFPAIGLLWDDCRAVLVPQVPVKIPERVITIDFLVSVRVGRRVMWFALEIDGAGHCSHEDELRAQHLPVIRFSEAEILAPTFTEDLKRRLRARVAGPRRAAA